jgi:glycine dehydrogenase subunit 2
MSTRSQPQETVQGALEVINELADWLIDADRHAWRGDDAQGRARMASCAACCASRPRWMARARTAQGHAGARKRARHQSGDGGLCRFQRREHSGDAEGRVDLAALKARLGPDVAGVMITNPNTCGLFERDMKAISDAVHAAGGYVYCDGANFNAIVGKVRPGDLGVDAMHINLHKTFSTPHGGGGPGSGPVVLSEALSPFAPLPFVARMPMAGSADRGGMPGEHPSQTFGRMTRSTARWACSPARWPISSAMAPTACARWPKTRCSTPTMCCAASKACSMRRSRLRGPCMHEALFSDAGLAEGFSTLDIAKGLIDEGYHPMTVYFPLVVHGAMLVEPTETESKAGLDRSSARCAVWRSGRAQGDPRSSPRRILRPAAGSMKRWRRASRCWCGRSQGRFCPVPRTIHL